MPAEMPSQRSRLQTTFGVINLSRDSSYRESIAHDVPAALSRARRMTVEGAVMIDIGAESTGTNADLVDVDARRLGVLGPLALRMSERVDDTVRVVCSGRLETLDEELSGHLLHVVVEKSAPDGLVDAVSQALRYSPVAQQDAASS